MPSAPTCPCSRAASPRAPDDHLEPELEALVIDPSRQWAVIVRSSSSTLEAIVLGGGPVYDPLAMGELTHLDETGRARMVDVSDKPASDRRAVARAVVRVSTETAGRV